MGLAMVLGCGPSVGTSTGQGADASTAEPAASSTGAAATQTTTGTTTTADTASGTTGTTSSADSTGPVPEACMPSEEQYASVSIDSEVGYDIHGTCVIEDISGALHVTLMDLMCDTGEHRVVSSELLGDYFEVGETLELVAAGEPEQWSHIALFDARGAFVIGSHSLSEAAPEFGQWLPPVEFTVVDAACETEQTGTDCEYHRVAVDYTFEGRIQRAYDGSAVEFSTLRIHTYALLFDVGTTCTLGPYGDVTMVAL